MAGVDHRTFSRFVESPDDLTGLIAYALYKADKVDFCDMHPEADVKGFILTANLPTRIDAYRLKAEIMLEDMTEEALGQTIEAIEKERTTKLEAMVLEHKVAIDDLSAKHQTAFEAVKKSLGFGRGLLSNALAGALVLVVSILLVIVVLGSQMNFWDGVASFFGYQKPQTTQQAK